MALDMFGGHKTEKVLNTLTAHDITLSVIPGGCTGLIQPLDISINQPYKDILKVSIVTHATYFIEERRKKGGGRLIHPSS